jgi:hypothetical protein
VALSQRIVGPAVIFAVFDSRRPLFTNCYQFTDFGGMDGLDCHYPNENLIKYC